MDNEVGELDDDMVDGVGGGKEIGVWCEVSEKRPVGFIEDPFWSGLVI